ncbi:unnamed protein product [Paramecium primaurelia]|uniref:Uncharacterized protein n=1 Tax=Paramecium primaurelia TaxID=5886 RepID=A0A8S1K2P7_PARPR|nr:unnamed protein product [Paramecium primaurelia]CAD8046536.1 unnamed protein product [Paramecium primaurelia]CAD8046537.1 unnamed protein product [Paramecium primaurelia]
MSVTLNINGKQVTCKLTETFGDLFDENVNSGKFQDKVWKIDGQIKLNILKNTKLNQFIQGNETIQCLDKQQANQFPNQIGQSGPIMAPQPQSPFIPVAQPTPSFISTQQPSSPFQQQQQMQNQPQPVLNQQQPQFPSKTGPTNVQIAPLQQFNKPNISEQLQKQANQVIINKPNIKRQQIDDRSGQQEISKVINRFNIQISEYGKKVILELNDGSFKATFLEENASEDEQDNIVLLSNDVIQQPEYQLKLPMGRDSTKSTKVLFLQGFKGIAIKWVTGLQTKFQFWIDE